MPDFTIEDLLCREPVSIDSDKISSFIKGKRVFVTGAAGSIGSELIRQIAHFNPECIVLFDRNEEGIFFLEKELNFKFPHLKVIPRLGSITNEDRLCAVFEETHPDIVYHAAANKHVPLGEENISEIIENNIGGTYIVGEVAAEFNCQSFVMISTDKAVNPSSIMGATKRVAEYCIQLLGAHYSHVNYVIVRFGNVLGSSGSVVPIFKSQIASGGPVTVTHPDMQRYFMTIPEASKLVLQASVMGTSGDVFVLDMGEQVKILDLAKKMITLSGFIPDVDIQIVFTGIRPGEKTYEELFFDYETTFSTEHPKIRNAKLKTPAHSVMRLIVELENLPANTAPGILREKLLELVPEALFGEK